MFLSTLKNKEGKPLVTQKEAEELSALKFGNGENMLGKDYFTYEIAWLLTEVGFEKTYNFLNAGWEKVLGGENIRKKMLFENPLMSPAKEKFLIDMNIYKTRVTVDAGEKCRKCGSAETISVTIQCRSADEASSHKFSCVQCKFRWTEH